MRRRERVGLRPLLRPSKPPGLDPEPAVGAGQRFGLTVAHVDAEEVTRRTLLSGEVDRLAVRRPDDVADVAFEALAHETVLAELGIHQPDLVVAVLPALVVGGRVGEQVALR